MHEIGKIDVEKYKQAVDSEIITDDVIITDNRIEHIIERRGQAFYDEFCEFFSDILKDPDYIFQDSKPNTAIASKAFLHKGKTINIVLRISVEGDNPLYKNSIITAIGENNRRFAQRLRNNKPIYVKVDISE